MTGVNAHTVEARCLDDHALLERIAADEAEIARLQARQLSDLADLARRPARVQRVDDDPGSVSAQWSPVGVFARSTADDEVGMRLRCRGAPPSTACAWRARSRGSR